MVTLIATAKLNDVDPQAWLADVLARIAGIPQSRLVELLPWEWNLNQQAACANHTGNVRCTSRRGPHRMLSLQRGRMLGAMATLVSPSAT
jgi:IS66 C-terminal element